MTDTLVGQPEPAIRIENRPHQSVCVNSPFHECICSSTTNEVNANPSRFLRIFCSDDFNTGDIGVNFTGACNNLVRRADEERHNKTGLPSLYDRLKD